jgi:hypothetical protein
MIAADLLVLYYYKDKIIAAIKSITTGLTRKFKYNWWVYLLLPIIGLLMDFVIAVLIWPLKWLISG